MICGQDTPTAQGYPPSTRLQESSPEIIEIYL
jgi:hypothetical protein